MINAVMKIGEWVCRGEGSLGALKNFVENPNNTGRYRKVVVILLEEKKGKYHFKEVDLEEFREDHLLKYLYRSGSSRGTDITPTSKLSGKPISHTYEERLFKCLLGIKSSAAALKLSAQEQNKLNEIINQLDINKKLVTEGLNERAKEVAKGEGAILTFCFESDGERKYLGDMEVFRKVLIQNSKTNYHSKYKTQSIGMDKVCSVCQKRRAEVYGFVNTYNFYTVDKPGFVTGGFRQEDAWKNYPVCFDCAAMLEEGKKYINDNLTFKFYRFNYLLIPKFFSDTVMNDVMIIMEDYFEKEEDKAIRASFEQKFAARLTDAEDEIFELFSEQKDNLNLNLMFYKEKQGAFNILLNIEDVLPSRMKKLFDVKKEVDELDIFKKPDKDGQRLLFFNFKLLRNVFPYVSKTLSYDKQFLEMVNKIFSLRSIDYDLLLKFIVFRIREKFADGKSIYLDVFGGFMLLYYIGRLGILKKGGRRMEIEIIKEFEGIMEDESLTLLKRIELFFDRHRGFFNSDSSEAKKCVFLVGVLIQKLLNIQFKFRDKSTPFRTKLQGLKLNEVLVKKLLPEAQNKLEEYGKNYYRQLEAIISQYMVAAGTKWQMSNDEISFYFVLGMNLSELFKTKEEDKDDDQSDQQG
jgi:CRISPR-associated protein Csh1